MYKIILRDYQKKAIDEILNSLMSHNEHVVALQTGLGKSVIISELAKIKSKFMPVVVLTNFSALIPQLAKHIENITGKKPNIIKANEHHTNNDSNIWLIMEQSFHDKVRDNYKNLKKCVLIKDEIDRGITGKRYKNIKVFLEPIEVIGFTATPFDAKGKLYWNRKQICEPITCKDAVREGYLANIRYFIPKASELIDEDNLVKNGIEYTEESNAREFLRNVNQITKSFVDKIKGKKTLVFCSTIEQAEAYCESINNNGIKAYVVHSKQKNEINKEYIRRFKGELKTLDVTLLGSQKEEPIDCLVSVTSLSIGFDAPNAEVLVNLRVIGSLPLFIQLFGRLVRPYDYEYKTVIDYGNCIKRFGVLTDFSIDSVEKGMYSQEMLEKRKNKLDKLQTYIDDDLLIENQNFDENFDDRINIALEQFKDANLDPKIELLSLTLDDGFYTLFYVGSKYYNSYIDFEANIDLKIIDEKFLNWIFDKFLESKMAQDLIYINDFFSNINDDELTNEEFIYKMRYNRIKASLHKAIKTRIFNIVAQNKKYASLAFISSWLYENSEKEEIIELIKKYIDDNFLCVEIDEKVNFIRKEKDEIEYNDENHEVDIDIDLEEIPF